MAELKTAEVPVFDHREFAGDPVDTSGFPYPDVLNGGTVPVVIEHVDGGTNGKLYSVSKIHCRSYVLRLALEQDSEDEVETWNDQYGNGFTVISTKGNNLAQPDIIRSATAPSGFIPYGMQDGDSLLRVLRASSTLRQAGIDTEWPLRIAQPKLLPFKADLIDPLSFKRSLLELKGTGAESFDPKELSEAAVALSSIELYVTYRAMSAAERIRELTLDGKLNTELAQKAIGIYNKLAPNRKAILEELELPEFIEESDIRQYLGVALPRLVGYHFGKLHEMGLVHGFPTSLNVNILGGIVDLDSVRGEALGLGDPVNNEMALARDFSGLVEGFLNNYPNLPSDEPSSERLGYTAAVNFLSVYLGQRKFTECEPQKKLDIFYTINKAFGGTFLYGSREQDGFLAQIIPETKALIEEFTNKMAYEFLKPIQAKELAGELYWRRIDGMEGNVWEAAGIGAGLWTNNDYLLNCRIPTQEELEAGLMDCMGADESQGRPFSSEYVSICVMPYLKEKGYLVEGESGGRLPKRLIEELVCKMLGVEPEHVTGTISSDVVSTINNGLFEWTASKFLPDYSEFWEEFKRKFREEYLTDEILAVVPDQDLITLPAEALEPYEYYWFPSNSGIERHYRNVPREVVEEYIARGLRVSEVGSSDEVLQTTYVHEDCLRLMITDGTFDDYTEIFPEDENSPDPSYLQFFDKKQDDTGATYAIFLYKRPDGSFRMEYNRLIEDADSV